MALRTASNCRCINWRAWLVRIARGAPESVLLAAIKIIMKKTPVVVEILQVANEEENMHDRFAVALSSEVVVGHEPRECPKSSCRSKVFCSSIDVVVVLFSVLQDFQLLLPRIALSGVESHVHVLKNGYCIVV